MKRLPLKIFSLRGRVLAGGKTILFLIALTLLMGAGVPAAQAQGDGAAGAAVSNGQNDGSEEDLLDFFLEAVEGVEPSGSNAPAVPPLPPSSGAVQPSATPSFTPSVPGSADIASPSPGWTPLPLSETKAEAADKAEPSVADGGPASPPAYDPADPFNPPPAAASGPQPFQPQAGSAVPLGQGRVQSSLPSPFWEDLSSDTSYYPPAESAGNWIQLEVGQSDSVSTVPAAPPGGRRPTSVYSVPPPPSQASRDAGRAAGVPVSTPEPPASAVDRAMNHAIQEPTASTQLLEPAERENLRKLFSDILPPSAQGRPAGAGTLAGTSQAEAAKPSPEAKNGGSAPKVNTGPSAISKAGGLLSEPLAKAAAQVADRPSEPELKSAPAAASSAAGTLAEIPLKSAGTAGGAPIAAAGKPVEEAKIKVAATAPAVEKSQPVSKGVETTKNKPEPAKAKSTPAKPAPAAKTTVKSSPAAAKPAPAPTKNSFSLIVVNETGRDRVAQQYGSVLKRLGYNVSSEVEGKAGKGPAGQTVISYRTGFKNQAQSVSRYLPGKKTLLEAKTNQVLASEIMIYIR